MRKNKNQVQQGDVIFIKVEEIPEKAKKVKHDGKFILAYGEATGHTHLLTATAKTKIYDDKGMLYIDNQLKKKLTVTHEEHKPVELSEGKWKVGRVVESDPFERAVRRVAD